jgi:hypothetical protein
MGSFFFLVARSMKWQSGPCLNRPHGPKLSFSMFLDRHASLHSHAKITLTFIATTFPFEPDGTHKAGK